jgi:hypothetical protein
LRQPRVDFEKLSYNHEQFNEYTQLYEQASKQDREDLKYFYKMVKYCQENPKSKDKAAVNFAARIRLDLIEIPEEFKNVTTDDLEIKRDRRARRQVIRTRTSRDLTNYDAWPCTDRTLMKSAGKQPCIRKIKLAPAILVKAFGQPHRSRTAYDGTGEYDFEDNNLDIFNIHDYR